MGLGPSTDAEKKKKNAETAREGIGRLARFLTDKDSANPSKFAQKEAERKKKAEAKNPDDYEVVEDPKTHTYVKRKKTVEPSKGFIGRMMDKYWYKKES